MAQTTLKQRQIAGGLDGWIPAEETWTYASADDPTFTFTIAADVTTKYSAGMKIKLTQGTVKYFIITAVSAYSGGNTTITVYGGTDYDLADSAISANAYSMMKSPQGFPMSPDKWSVQTTDSGGTRQQASPTQNAWYNINTTTINIPIGLWDVDYTVAIAYNYTGTGNVISTLSTGNNSETNTEFSAYFGSNASGVNGCTVYKKGTLDLTTKDTYYLNTKTGFASITTIYNLNSTTPMFVRATCAYL